MKNESKALDSLDKIIDLIWHEEGRLAIINRYGAYLSDEEKTQATQLITSQKANMDRLFTIYRDELLPLMHDVRKNSDVMNPLFDKLLASAMIARQMNGEQNVTEQSTVIDAVRSEAAAMQEGTALVNNADVNASTSTEVPPVETTAVVSGENNDQAVVAETSEAAIVEGGTGVAVEGGSEITTGNENPVMIEATGDAQVAGATVGDSTVFVPAEGSVASEIPVAVSDTPVGGSENALGENNPPSSEVTLSSVEEESSLPFVLSPIDSDVAPAVSEDEAKKAEETVAAADQQLGAIDAVKTDIMASTELTEEEKEEKLEQYTRISDVAVKAILVTKAQCEKLLASRASQKALLKPVENAASEEVSDGVVALPDLTASEGEAVVALPASAGASAPAEAATTEEGVVIPAIGGDTPAADVSATEEKTAIATGDGLVLPMIGGDAPVAETPIAGTNAGEVTASDLVLEIPGAASTDSPVEQNGQNDLQAMIEQANALYKEGKVAEAQALFEKIGTMSKESQGGSTSEVAEDAAVLVKK